MDNALIVSNSEKQTASFTEMLEAASVRRVVVLQSCGEARRYLLDRDVDLVMINSPLQDESGENFARHIVSKGASQVILAVKSEHFDAVTAGCENEGVLTISKPVNQAVFWSALMLAKSAWGRIRRFESENERLKRTIEDIRIVDKAKWALVSRLKLSEEEAHRLIEKQAMNTRSTRRQIAEEVLKTYGN